MSLQEAQRLLAALSPSKAGGSMAATTKTYISMRRKSKRAR